MANSIRDESILGDPEFANLIDELTEQMQSHHELDLEDYLKRYPQYADQLEQLVPAMEMLICQGNGPGESHTGQTESPSSTPLGTIGGKLGDFRIIREIGRGGMGVVYEVEQLSLKRRMALKVLPFAGILDEQALKRFKNEALAAATLNHPNIVQVHSVGCDRGVHYYAMQLIEGQTLADTITELRRIRKHRSSEQADEIANVGSLSIAIATGSLETPANDDDVPITEPSKSAPATSPTTDTKREVQAALSTVPSLETRAYFRSVANLGIQAAEALEHAHANGISHRDIKPGNLMIDGAGKLWVTDFGLARIEASAPMTMTGDMLGTLRYMCPETAAGGRERLVVDQRTDIYSLGVTLYELLTLEPAFEAKDRKELFHKIIFSEPRPPRRISKSIPANLETIVLKAMRKDPADRYATAGELANDLKRFLDDEPIRAKPPTLVDRTRMWSRRNRTIVVAAAILLMVATIGSLIATGLIWQEQVRTANALHESRENEKKADEKNAESDTIIKFLLDDLLFSASLERPPEDPFTVADVLANAEEKLNEAFDEHPGIESRIRHTLGQTYEKVGNYEAAEQHLRRSLFLDKQRYGPTNVNTLESMSALCRILTEKGELIEANDIAEQALEIRRQITTRPLDMIGPWDDLALVRKNQGRFDEAEKLYRRALEVCKREFPDGDQKTLQYMENVAKTLKDQRRLVEARVMHQEILDIHRRNLGPNDGKTITAMLNLSKAFADEHNYDQACSVIDEAIESRTLSQGVENPLTLEVQRQKVGILFEQREFAEARLLNQKVLDIRQRTLGAEHPATLRSRTDVLNLQSAERKYAELDKLYEQLLEIQTRVIGLEHPDTRLTINMLGRTYNNVRRFDDARRIYQDLVTINRRVLGPEHRNTVAAMHNLAVVIGQAASDELYIGNRETAWEEARSIAEKVLEIYQRTRGIEHLDTLRTQLVFALLLRIRGEPDEARKHFEQILEIQRNARVHQPDIIGGALQNLGGIHADIEDYTRAVELYQESCDVLKTAYGDNHPDRLMTMNFLGQTLARQRKFDEARIQFEEVVGLGAQGTDGDESKKRQTLNAMRQLAVTFRELGQNDKAHALLAKTADVFPKELGATHPWTIEVDWELADLLLQQGKYEDAYKHAQKTVKLLEQASEDNPIMILVKSTLARTLDGLEKFEEARQIWDEIEGPHDNFDSEDNSTVARGIALHLASAPDTPVAELDRALELATESTELDPAYGESWRALGVVHAASHHWKESRNAFNKAIALGCPRQLLNSAMLERIDNDVNRSDEDFQQLMVFVRAHSK